MKSDDPGGTCPQCGGSLVTYALGDAEAPVCERCGWVGIDADHQPEGEVDESWDDALRRFYRRHTDPRPVTDGEGETGESADRGDE